MAAYDSLIIASQDSDFIEQAECRGIRLQLEYMKPELQLTKMGIVSTVVLFGSARIKSPEVAAADLSSAQAAAMLAPEDRETAEKLRKAEEAMKLSKYYVLARDFAKYVTEYGKENAPQGHYVVITGGGPGIMEAGNRGAKEAGGSSIGLSIKLPFEQKPNKYITEGLSFNFRYFSLRKMHFMKRAKALGCFPGGYGTMDELFEVLTLVQTNIVPKIPIILFGKEFWTNLINWKAFVDQGLISPGDLGLFRICDTAEEGCQFIRDYYQL